MRWTIPCWELPPNHLCEGLFTLCVLCVPTLLTLLFNVVTDIVTDVVTDAALVVLLRPFSPPF